MPTGRGESYWDNIAAAEEAERERATWKDSFGRLRFPGTIPRSDADPFEEDLETGRRSYTTSPTVTINGRKYRQSDTDWPTMSGMYPEIINKIGMTEGDTTYDQRYGNLVADDVAEKFAKAYGEMYNDDSFFSDNGGFGAFRKTIGLAMGGANLLGGGLNALASGGGQFAGTAASFLPEGGFQSLLSSLGEHAAGAGGGLSDIANALGADAPWGVNEASELTRLGPGVDAAGQSDMLQTLAPNFPGMTTATNAAVGGGQSIFDMLASGTGLGAAAGLGLTAAQQLAQHSDPIPPRTPEQDVVNDMDASSQGPGADPWQLNTSGMSLAELVKAYGPTLGPLLAGGLGAIGATQQADAYRDVADKYFGMGQPYRDRLNASYAPGFTMANEPGYQGAMDQSAQSVLRGLSTKGNPFDNPGVLSEAQKYVTNTTALPQLNTYRSQLGTFGQLGVNTAGTADMQGANTSGGALNAIGYGLSNALAPKDDLTALLNKAGFGLNTRGWGY